jgi:ribosomal-protein-alanine N-acetyltransferase
LLNSDSTYMLHVIDEPGWRMALPSLEGEGVRLREVRPGDAGALMELLTDPAVAAHISTPPPSIEAFEGFIAWAHRERRRGQGACFGIVPNGLNEAAGLIQLRTQDPSFFVADWGFALGAPFWGTGIFTEAAVLAAGFAFDVLDVHRLEARAVTHNGRGNGALQKIGAKTEGVLAKAFKTDSGYVEQLLWALTAEDLAERPRERFRGDAARARVAQAIEDTRQLFGRRRPRPGPNPHLYPFFVAAPQPHSTCCRCGAPLHHGCCAS